MSTCGFSGYVRVLVHDVDATRQWQRWATPEEVDYFHHSGDLPPSETVAQLAVFSCEEHMIDAELSTETHDVSCRAPGANEPDDCSVCAP